MSIKLIETKKFFSLLIKSSRYHSHEDSELVIKDSTYRKWGAGLDHDTKLKALRVCNGSLNNNYTRGRECNQAISEIMKTCPTSRHNIIAYSRDNNESAYILAHLLAQDTEFLKKSNGKMYKILIPAGSKMFPTFAISPAREMGDTSIVLARDGLKKILWDWYIYNP